MEFKPGNEAADVAFWGGGVVGGGRIAFLVEIQGPGQQCASREITGWRQEDSERRGQVV